VSGGQSSPPLPWQDEPWCDDQGGKQCLPRGGLDQDQLTSFTRLGALEPVHTFVTDDGTSDADAKELERRRVEVLMAE
jgi:hypothetical protein